MVLRKLTLKSGESETDAVISCSIINGEKESRRKITITVDLDDGVLEDLGSYADKYLNKRIPDIFITKIVGWLENATNFIRMARTEDPSFK